MTALTNNRQNSTLRAFVDGVRTQNRGRLPLKMRMDDGTENGGIELLLLSVPACTVKRGTSKHNQRIERAWRFVVFVVETGNENEYKMNDGLLTPTK